MPTGSDEKLPPGIVGDMGIALTRFRCGQIGQIFREKPTQDHGIDSEIEIVENGLATGRLIAVQVKCGDSYFDEPTDEGFVFRFSARHYDYWVRHSLPVIGVLVDYKREVCYWSIISEQSVRSAGDSYKAVVSSSQTISADFASRLIDIATPVIPGTSFQVFSEQDQSTGPTRRVSRYVRLNASEKRWSKEAVRQLILQMTSDARSSTYYRNSISENTHKDRVAEVVWVYIYRSENDRDTGSFIARSIWIDPDLSVDFHPTGFGEETDVSGLSIDWNDKFHEMVSLIDEMRSTKSEYIKYAKSVLDLLRPILNKYHYQVPVVSTRFNYSEFIDELSAIEADLEETAYPPHECDRLGHRVAEMIAQIENAKLIAARIDKELKETDLSLFQDYINEAHSKIVEAEYELRQIE